MNLTVAELITALQALNLPDAPVAYSQPGATRTIAGGIVATAKATGEQTVLLTDSKLDQVGGF